MSLQLGMDCLLSLSDDKVLEKLSSFLFQLAELDQDEVNVTCRFYKIKKKELILKNIWCFIEFDCYKILTAPV